MPDGNCDAVSRGHHSGPKIRQISHISEWSKVGRYPSPLLTGPASGPTHKCHLEIVQDGEIVQTGIVFKELPEGPPSTAFYYRSGPRKELAFHPKEVRACIVTCGGLCPGLNTVIREVVMCLMSNYGVEEVYGIQYGYCGFYEPELQHIHLTQDKVAHIHHEGGTILGSSRGGFDRKKIADSIESRKYNMVFVVGGDGTHKGAKEISDECKVRGLKVAVAGIPKTIDNDIRVIDKSFGFESAVEEAQRAIRTAHIEAKAYPNGIGIVKLMGRHSAPIRPPPADPPPSPPAGFITVFATLASRDVNVCLIPEVKFSMEPLCEYLEALLKQDGHAVIVVAEGAGQVRPGLPPASSPPSYSPGPQYLKERISAHFHKINMKCNVKYIDPTYMIRTIPANAADSVYCTVVAHNAVHGAMHVIKMKSFTGFTTALVNEKCVYLPFDDIIGPPATVDPNGRMWGRVLSSTGQPDFE
eukprot:tig00020660_g12515.t1